MEGRFEILKRFPSDHGWVTINNQPIEVYHPNSSLLDLGFEPEDFVNASNNLLDSRKIKVPREFPQPITQEQSALGKTEVRYNHWLAVCMANCIKLERLYQTNTSRLLRELMNREPSTMLHSASISVLAIEYLSRGFPVALSPQIKADKKPDLMINNILCDVKTIRETDWLKEAVTEANVKKFRQTGMGPPLTISERITYEVGMAIRDRALEGIRQADMLYFDFSLKYLPWLYRIGKVEEKELPQPKKYRFAFFDWVYGDKDRKRDCSGYYIDLDSSLWDVLRYCDKKMASGILPPPDGGT